MKNSYRSLQVEVQDSVAVMTIDNPPVNQLSEHLNASLVQALAEAEADEAINGVIITGQGRNFIAGADISQLQQVTSKTEYLPQLIKNHEFLNSIENFPKPVIAAINGNCLGGGFELALCCHYRLAVTGVNIGLPEVKLGIFPGGGGTQRLPRLIGLPAAMDMMTTGKFIKAEKVFIMGGVDEVVPQDKLITAALRAVRAFKSGLMNQRLHITSQIHTRLPSAGEKLHLLNHVKAMMAKKAKGHLAPFKIIECVEKGLSGDFAADIELEAKLFSETLVSDVAKNMIGIFFNERSAGKLDRIKDIAPAKPQKVAMLGGGVMGSGIIHLLLSAGCEVMLWDINDQALAKGVESIKKSFAFKIKTRKVKPAQLEELLTTKLTTTNDLADLADVDLIIEAVLEDMKIKQDIWLRLEGICRDDVIFGTNTSALPITEMATILKSPGRMIGLHFFNPAERMPLLEIICAEQTSDSTLATSVAFGRKIKKVPVVVNDGPGFYVSRQLGALMGDSVYLVADGVDGAAIEKAYTDFGLPMGPAALADLTGIDINYHVSKIYERNLGDRYKIHPLTEIVYQVGDYGRKMGRGYLDYSGDKPVPNPNIARAVAGYLNENKVKPQHMTDDEIMDFAMAVSVNEAALMMEQGICDRPADMDLAMVYGCGFPAYRGGVLRYADKWGLKNVYDKLIDMEKRYGKRFSPAEKIKNMAQTGQTFYQD